MTRNAGRWWQQLPEIERAIRPGSRDSFNGAWYRFGNGLLGLDCDDRQLTQRFEQIYSETAIAAPGEPSSLPEVRCTVRSFLEHRVAHIAIDDSESLDSVRFWRTLFPDRGYVSGPTCGAGWESIAAADTPDHPFGAIRGDEAAVDLSQPWQPFIANYVVNRLLRRQKDVLFFHASSVSIGGRGAMLVGPKGSGKTTTALSLGARGGGFCGDEIAAVCTRTDALLPFRRAVSIKSGPCARQVRDRLAGAPTWTERFPDGSARTTVPFGRLFPESPVRSVPLTCVFFLEGFLPRPAVRRFAFSREQYRLLTPIASSMWSVPAAIRMLQIARLLDRVACYSLSPGGPEETAELVERTVLECQA